jgi:hypothetical protein
MASPLSSPPLDSSLYSLPNTTFRIQEDPEEIADFDDDDDPELQQALALSMQQAQNDENARANRFTMSGTNIDELAEALRISAEVR